MANETAQLTGSQIRNRVDRCIILEQQIAELNRHLKDAKADLIAEAKARQDEHRPIPDGGTYVEFAGTNDCVAHVTFPKPTLRNAIDGDSPVYLKIVKLIGNGPDFQAMFSVVPKFALVPDFRAVAELTFAQEPGKARKLMALCTTTSSPRVSCEVKEKTE